MLAAGTRGGRRAWVLVGALLILGIGAVLLLRFHRPGPPIRVLLVVSEGGAGLSPHEARAAATLLQEHLESLTPLSTTIAMGMPVRSVHEPGHWLLCQVEPSRVGNLLALRYRWAWSEQLGGASVPWTERVLSAGSPVAIAASYADGMPLKARRGALVRSVPRDPEHFWSLVQAMVWRTGGTRQQEAEALVGAVAQAEPDCVSAWVTYGNLLFRNIMDIPERDRLARQFEAEANLSRALMLVPGHPRGTMLLAELKTSSGNTREALDLILGALRARPGSPTLLLGFTRAARTAGLLELAKRADALRLRNSFPEMDSYGWDKTLLYSGEWDRFRQSLNDRPGYPPHAAVPFFRGYLALLRGREAEAIPEFQRAEEVPNGTWQYVQLARVFRLALEKNRPVALKALDELGEAMAKTRIPDPELTIHLAEAYAFLDQPNAAMRTAGQAFTQGFGCREWYERSPLLVPLHAHPRWKFLLQHVQERRALLEGRFPISVLPE